MDAEENDIKIRRNVVAFSAAIVLATVFGVDGKAILDEAPVLKHANSVSSAKLWLILTVAHAYLWLRFGTTESGKQPFAAIASRFNTMVFRYRARWVMREIKQAVDCSDYTTSKHWLRLNGETLRQIREAKVGAAREGNLISLAGEPTLGLDQQKFECTLTIFANTGLGVRGATVKGEIEMGWPFKAWRVIRAVIGSVLTSQETLERTLPHYLAITAVGCIGFKWMQILGA